MFPPLKIYCPNEIKQALLGKAVGGSPPEHGVVPPGLGQRMLERCTVELEGPWGTWGPSKGWHAGAEWCWVGRAVVRKCAWAGNEGLRDLIPPGDLISAWIPSSVGRARLYCPLRGSVSPLVEKKKATKPQLRALLICV